MTGDCLSERINVGLICPSLMTNPHHSPSDIMGLIESSAPSHNGVHVGMGSGLIRPRLYLSPCAITEASYITPI